MSLRSSCLWESVTPALPEAAALSATPTSEMKGLLR